MDQLFERLTALVLVVDLLEASILENRNNRIHSLTNLLSRHSRGRGNCLQEKKDA